ncbi:hypothetical protein Taro_023532 [Colocasia esculenta]|uniref:Uncharacterized protein n=1 Tax=Colocasia esculenta TaxID=4460 RepID=A0A843VET1_COLES|nr:hypothetical protein [Colocasia esculenta]
MLTLPAVVLAPTPVLVVSFVAIAVRELLLLKLQPPLIVLEELQVVAYLSTAMPVAVDRALFPDPRRGYLTVAVDRHLLVVDRPCQNCISASGKTAPVDRHFLAVDRHYAPASGLELIGFSFILHSENLFCI